MIMSTPAPMQPPPTAAITGTRMFSGPEITSWKNWIVRITPSRLRASHGSAAARVCISPNTVRSMPAQKNLPCAPSTTARTRASSSIAR